MKIGIAGGVANTHYQLCRWLKKLGYDAFFAHRSEGSFIFSHPVWEEKEFFMDHRDVASSPYWPGSYWTDLFRKLDYIPEPWCVGVDGTCSSGEREAPAARRAFMDNMFYSVMENRNPYFKAMREKLSVADFLILGNKWPEVIGYFTGKPYAIWPSGGDMREAAGEDAGPHSISPAERIKKMIHRRLLKRSFESAELLLTHTPVGKGCLNGCGSIRLKKERLTAFPVDCLKEKKKNRKEIMAELEKELGFKCPSGSLIFFIPSRIDFRWKGTDKFLRAYLRFKDKNIFLLCAGWGEDRERALSLVRESGGENRTVFLDACFSKPMLLKIYQAVDMVVDQFNLGDYGTAALEAMSAGTPVMMWFHDIKAAHPAALTPPPILNAKEENDIFELLGKIIAGGIDLARKGEESAEWIEEVHGYRNVLGPLMQDVEKIARTQRQG
jgi:glycosyltransferase involved in cell wall biosynthesis